MPLPQCIQGLGADLFVEIVGTDPAGSQEPAHGVTSQEAEGKHNIKFPFGDGAAVGQ